MEFWDAIGFFSLDADSSGEICQEKKALYKLISGLHSSISIHIAADYLLDESTNLVLTPSHSLHCIVLSPFNFQYKHL